MFEVGDIIKNKFTGDKRVVLSFDNGFYGVAGCYTVGRAKDTSVARWVRVGHIKNVDAMMKIIRKTVG